MWSDFDFNEPYDGEFNNVIYGVELPKEYVEFMKSHNGGEGDGGGELFGVNSVGQYFILPEMIENP